MQYVFFALAGLLVGGVIATRQQRRPLWVSLTLAVLAAIFLWAGMRESTR
ncbi:hypothetical protein DFJ64_0158 [Thermasporomyces composti]|uniref:Uncharacterized protein n=1 Tax=Thermasporomyces composti TaxID=696763 RepID=A0A3D9UZ30_THECX|nr:hypothetical protein DFJ64_0158 [Thermasporomyces composti]